MKSWKERVRAEAQKDRVCNLLYDDMISYLCISVRPRCPVNIGYTPASLHHHNVLDEPIRRRLLVSQSELICKSSKGVTPAGGGGGGGGGEVEQRIESQ